MPLPFFSIEAPSTVLNVSLQKKIDAKTKKKKIAKEEVLLNA